MPIRISGVNLPDNKRIAISLTYLKGIGVSRALDVLVKAGIDINKRTKELLEEEVSKIRQVIEAEGYELEGDLQRRVLGNIKRLKEIGSWRGIRHARHLPVRGQRTKTNSRTVRGNVRKTTTSGRKIILAGNAQAGNIFWQVGSSATLGTNSVFQGTIMADQSITLVTGATLNGRALARIAAVTLDASVVTKPGAITTAVENVSAPDAVSISQNFPNPFNPSTTIQYNLVKEGYGVLLAETGETGLELARTKKPDLVVLDLMLPDLNGIDICKKLREQNIHTPIIMLTAKSQIQDKVNALSSTPFLGLAFSMPLKIFLFKLSRCHF